MQANKIIKRLGYEKAKVLLQGLGNEHDAALLEYRRANNIFEVGDWIVSTLNLGSKPESMVCQIKFSHGGVVTTQSACGEIVNFHSSKFRHATNAEIKAKRRLDLPESVVQSSGELP